MQYRLTVALHIMISIVIFSMGIFVWVEKKMIISGKLTGSLHILESPSNIIIAFSYFLVSFVVTYLLLPGEKIKKISRWLLILALMLYLLGAFL